MQTMTMNQKIPTKLGQTDNLEYIKLTDPKLYLRWSIDKYKFIKVELIKVRA